MGIIKQILSEELIKNKGWVSLIELLDNNGFKDFLLPHKIIGNVLQYSLDGYKKIISFADEIEHEGNEEKILMLDTTYLKIDDFLFYTKYRFLRKRMIRLVSNDYKNGYIWFDMNDEFHSNIIGSGMFNYAHDIKDDKIRKVSHKNDRVNFTLDKYMPLLSEKYPDLFVKTIKTKSGYVQDKVKPIDKNILDKIKHLEYETIVNIFDGYYSNIIDKFIKEHYPKEHANIMELFDDVWLLYNNIKKAINATNINYELMDFHLYNLGYDKDGKLKAFDI
jgi:hypothetical protein